MELGERPKSADTESRDTTLLSASSIGSPTAFSTAIKPPPGLSLHPSTDSSLSATHEYLQNHHDLSAEIAGRLSLGSDGTPGRRPPLSEGLTDGTMSLDDTSLGVLDLEALQDSSMTRFLTSPHPGGQPPGTSATTGSQPSLPSSRPSVEPSGFRLQLSSSSLGQSSAVGQAASLGAAEGRGAGTSLGVAEGRGVGTSLGGAEGAKAETARRRSPPNDALRQDSSLPDEGLEDSSDVLIQIPQELLVRVSVTSDTECSSQSSYDEPLGELEVPASQSGLEGRSGDFPPGVQPQGGSLPLTRLSGDGHETESLPAPQAAASQLTPAAESLSLNTGAALVVTQPVSSVQSEAIVPGRGERSASSDQPVPHPSDDALSTPQFDVDQLLQGLSREGGTAVPDWLGEDGEENADATLIGDEAEPTVMREADEFSQFEPTHLASMMSRESFLQSTGRPVTTGQESGARQTHPTTTTTMTTSTASIVSGSGSTRGLLQRQQQVTATRFPATVDRHHVLHGDLKLSEQVRPVVEGFTDQDEFSLAGARSTAHRDPSEAALQGSQRTEAIASEGYFSAGQRSELDVSDLRTAEGQQLDAGSDSDEEYASARGESATSLAMGDTTSVSREGLPSAYLVPTSPHAATSYSASEPGSPSPCSLPSSLNELAAVLGTKDGEESFDAPGLSLKDRENTAKPSNSGVYNPFESDDNGSVGSFGQEEFQEQDSDSFMAQLARDEEEIEKENLFADAPSPSAQGLSFDQNLTGASGSHFVDSSAELSIGSYFNRRSHKLGALPSSSSKPPPSERPQFSEQDGHIIQSPPTDAEEPAPHQPRDPTAPWAQPRASPNLKGESPDISATSEGELDRTLVASGGSRGETSQTSIGAAASAEGGLRSGTESADLTPVVTVHTPFPAQFQIPKLDLSSISSLSATPAATIATAKKELSTRKSGPAAATETSTAAVPTFTTSGASPGTEPRPSSGMDSELPSQYWRPSSDTSTLVFPEVSAMTLSPSPDELGTLDFIPTPSIARLSGGFDVTDSTLQDGSFSASLGSEPGRRSAGRRTDETPGSLGSSLQSELKVVRSTRPSRSVTKHDMTSANSGREEPTSPAKPSPVPKVSQSPPAVEPLTSSSPLRTPAVVKQTDPTASPKTEAARRKLAKLQATLDNTRFDADRFLATLKSPSPPSSPRKGRGETDSKPGKRARSRTPESLPSILKIDAHPVATTGVSSTPHVSTTLSASLPVRAERQKESVMTSEASLSSSSRLPLAFRFEEIDSTKPKRYVPLGVTETELKSSSIVSKKQEKRIESSGEQSLSEFLPETPLPRHPATTTSGDTEPPASFTQATAPTAAHTLNSHLQHTLDVEIQTSTPKVEVTPPTPTLTGPSPAKGGETKLRKSATKSVKHGSGTTGTRWEPGTQKPVHRSARAERQSPAAADVTASSSGTRAFGHVGSPRRASPAESTGASGPGSANTTGRHRRVIKTKEEGHTHTTSRVAKPGSTIATPVSPTASPSKPISPKPNPTKASPTMTSTAKASPTKASSTKASSTKASFIEASTTKASPTKASSTKTSPTKASPTKTSPLRKRAQVARTAANLKETSHSTTGTTAANLQETSHSTTGTTAATGTSHSTPGTTAATGTSHSTPGTTAATEAHLQASLQHGTPSVQPASVPIVFPQEGASPPGRPIYTSPHVHPHTTSSPSKKRTGEGSEAPPPSSLHVPDSLCFDTACCTGTLSSNHLSVGNSGERWLQLNFSVSQIYRNGAECGSGEHRAFSLPQRCFVGPEKSEAVKVVFSPHLPGSYEAVLTVRATLVVGGDQDSDTLSSSVVLKALAEEPKLEVVCGDRESPELDYGVLVGGTSVSLPLHLANHGLAELPLRLNIAAATLSQLYFSFGKVPPSLLPSSPQLYSQPYTTRVILPPKPSDQAKPKVYTLQVHFKAPKKYADDSSDPGPPDEISAQVDIAVDGASAEGNLLSVPLRAIVGVARLHVPRSLQALSLSCTAGQAVTREVPFKNAGNIPLRVRLRMSADSQHFTISPDFLLMEPEQEVQVGVTFSPDSSPSTSEGYLTILVEPSGPNYEMKLRGTATSEQKQKDGLLSCSKRSMYWGGVKLNNSVQQVLVLYNSFPYKVPLQLSIRHSDSAFQLEGIANTGAQQVQQDSLPQEQLSVHVTFTPAVGAVYSDALDIYDKTHSKKYRIPLCGYGGSSQVEVVNARQSPQGLWIDMGEVVAGQRSVVKVSLYNSGQRAAFAKARCYPVNNGSSPLPLTRASVSPSELIIQPQHMKELLLVYHASEADSHQCSEFPSPLAQLVLLTGDEIARQRFIRSRSGEKAAELANPVNQAFLKQFPDQSSVPTELDISSFTVENEEEFFEHHVRKLSVSLSGAPPTKTPAVHGVPRPLHSSSSQTTTSARLTQTQSETSPPKALQTLSPSHTPHSGSHTHQSPTSLVVRSRILALPDTPVGHCAEQFLEIHNPYPHPLQWHLDSVASPFVKDTADGSHDIYKATYSAFWVHERRGTVLPYTAAKVLVTFQPHDRGSFSQVWDLHVSSRSIEAGTNKLKLSFSGKAVTNHRTDNMRSQILIQDMPSGSYSHESVSKSEARFQPGDAQSDPISRTHPASAISMATHSSTTFAAVSHLGVSPSRVTPPRKAVYIRDDNVEFPATRVGERSTVKLRVCNRDVTRYQFEVIRPNPPFSVSHYQFELGSRQCARLPVHFSPTRDGDHKGILAIKTSAGHQTFAVLRAKSHL